MNVADFDFDLPSELIAQTPPPERGTSRLLVLDRHAGTLSHSTIGDLPLWLHRRDLLVLNDTRVFPARLLGRRQPGGGAMECLLLRRLDANRWEALVHPGQRLRVGSRFELGNGSALHGEVLELRFHGRRVVRLWAEDGRDVMEAIEQIGHIPLPPYIDRLDTPTDRERYQTVYARATGSVAAPTAGLHLTAALLDTLRLGGIDQTEITLHVGYGTFKPVRTERVEDHVVDSEAYEIGAAASEAITRAIHERRRIVAVGTTTTRALESMAARSSGGAMPVAGTTDLFIHPGYEFLITRALLTNFHLPRSSLLMLVCAFAGREAVLAAYQEAIARRYRFYSYGDAMLIV